MSFQEGIVEIKGAAREAGSRSKIAVCTYDENVDPVGSCVGPRGQRVQAVVDELNGEKIDIINWSEDPGKMISAALSPANVEMVLIKESQEEKSALVVVPDYQLSLAIGKEGQNVRLAARLCGWKIDIKSHSKWEEMEKAAAAELEAEKEAAETEEPAEAAEKKTVTASAVKRMKKAELVEFAAENGIELDPKATNADMAEAIISALEL